MLFTKMWWPPVVALAGALWKDRQSLARYRPGWIDVPMALWCVWPIAQWFSIDENPEPQAWIASLYLAAAWGVPWFLGRVYFCGDRRRQATDYGDRRWARSDHAIALIEGVFGPQVYGWVYEPHPFRSDGVQRYVGFGHSASLKTAINMASGWLQLRWLQSGFGRARPTRASAAVLPLSRCWV